MGVLAVSLPTKARTTEEAKRVSFYELKKSLYMKMVGC